MIKNQEAIKKACKSKRILTEREIEYLSLAGLGYKNCQIASILYVSPSTVKKTLELIFRKINAKDRANAVAIAFMHNILNTEILSLMDKSEKVLNYEKMKKKQAS